MDSILDTQFKRLMNKYYQKSNTRKIQINLYKKMREKVEPTNKRNKIKNKILKKNNSMMQSIKIKRNDKNKFVLKKCNTLSNNTINKEIKTSDNNYSINDRNSINLVSSDILREKPLFLSLRKQFSINSLLKKFKFEIKEETEKRHSIIKKNLSLCNLKKLSDNYSKDIKKKENKKMSRFALRNNLYYKYSSILSGGKKPEINRNIDYYYQNRKTEDSKQNFSYSEPNNNFNFINMHKRNLNLPNLKNNQQIIKNDEKIYVNCLFSKINARLNESKIFQKKNSKTIYNIQNEKLYKRIHALDKAFKRLMKHNQ